MLVSLTDPHSGIRVSARLKEKRQGLVCSAPQRNAGNYLHCLLGLLLIPTGSVRLFLDASAPFLFACICVLCCTRAALVCQLRPISLNGCKIGVCECLCIMSEFRVVFFFSTRSRQNLGSQRSGSCWRGVKVSLFWGY